MLRLVKFWRSASPAGKRCNCRPALALGDLGKLGQLIQWSSTCPEGPACSPYLAGWLYMVVVERITITTLTDFKQGFIPRSC